LIWFTALALAGAAHGQEAHVVQHAPAAVDATRAFVLEGFVLAPGGAPAEGALVVTGAGGRALTDPSGFYHLEIALPRGAELVRVTAVSQGGVSAVGSASVAVPAGAVRAVVDPVTLVLGGSCSRSWLPMFGEQPDIDFDVLALAVYDDGSGPELYAAGSFSRAGALFVNNIAKWDGEHWSPLGTNFFTNGVNGTARALAVHDDGSGPALFVAGDFSQAGGMAATRIARWNGSWSVLNGGPSGRVYSLAVYDDGAGPDLYAAGGFVNAGGIPVHSVGRWDGSSWSSLGTGLDPNLFTNAYALAAFDDGSGPALFVGGSFSTAGGVPASNIARWNGTSWSAVGAGADGTVLALAAFDDGSGPALHAGGDFTNAGGSPASHVAKWDGATWSALGGGVDDTVLALAAHDDGGGAALYAGGFFTLADGVSAPYVARWDGSGWSAPGTWDSEPIRALAVYDDGGGSQLFAGAQWAGNPGEKHVARFDGTEWRDLGTGLDGAVGSLAVFDDGNGPALYVGGQFARLDGVPVEGSLRWDGVSWTDLGSANRFGAMLVDDDGTGPRLLAATSGGVVAWDGVTSTPLGIGLSGTVLTMTRFDDGNGSALFVGGFLSVGGLPSVGVARWDGTSWSAVGGQVNNFVLSLAGHDDGNGPALFAGGHFTTIGGLVVNRIARWDGTAWSALGSGMNNSVSSLVVHDDGSGPALYAGGRFSQASGTPVTYLARWNGSSWSPFGTWTFEVNGLFVVDDGEGPALFASGPFAQGVPALGLAKWNGTVWSPLAGGISGNISAVAAYDGGSGPELFFGGSFARAIDTNDSFLARWGLSPVDLDLPVIHCPEPLVVYDAPSGPSGETVVFSVTASDCHDPAPLVQCTPPSGSVFPRGKTIVTCTATDAAGNQATCEFPVIVTPHKIRLRGQ